MDKAQYSTIRDPALQRGGRPGLDWFHPLTGWFLVEAMRLEDIRPGFLAFATRASPISRNVMAMAIAADILGKRETFLFRANGEIDDEQCTYVQVADAIMTMKPDRLLEAALGAVPSALLTILRKIGSGLLNSTQAYARLHALLASDQPDQQERARVLGAMDGPLDDDLMQVVEVLHISILTVKSAWAVRTAVEAHKLNARLPIIQRVCSSAKNESLRQSISDAPHFHVSAWVKMWLGKADRLPSLGIAFESDPCAERILPSTAKAFGRRWENCISGHASAMAMGATAYFALSDLKVIVVLTRTCGGWLLSGIHGHANMPVLAQTAQRVKERLSRQGIICLLPAGPPPELADLAGGFFGIDDLDFEFEGLGG